jgi:hypothetical protein
MIALELVKLVVLQPYDLKIPSEDICTCQSTVPAHGTVKKIKKGRRAEETEHDECLAISRYQIRMHCSTSKFSWSLSDAGDMCEITKHVRMPLCDDQLVSPRQTTTRTSFCNDQCENEA